MGPLEGIRVLDFTRVLAGPYCTKMLRDLGADVLKVEPPSGDIGRAGFPHVGPMSLYYIQQNAGKRAISLDLNYEPARAITRELLKDVDVVVENFRPGTLERFGFGYEEVRAINPRIVYASLSGYGQSTSWSTRPAFAPTIQAEVGHTRSLQEHFGESLSEVRNDGSSHADVYTGLQGVIAVLAALEQRHRTGEGQRVDVAMAATMISVNESAGALLSDIDLAGEPDALAAPDSHIFTLPGDVQVTIAASPIFTPIFARFCTMMRRNDLLGDPRFASANLRRENLAALLDEVTSWMLTFRDLDDLQSQVSEAGLAIGVVRSIKEFARSAWAEEWGAIVKVDDRSGGTVAMPGAPWKFSGGELPPPGVPAFQGEHNAEVLSEHGVSAERIAELRAAHVLVSRRHPLGPIE